ncbi:MAG: hypothetical protein JW946_04945 [Candidatus Omnitrophica bacterium]|nr:hypothetical protein [Candidatus Omnitrophota bacterium]
MKIGSLEKIVVLVMVVIFGVVGVVQAAQKAQAAPAKAPTVSQEKMRKMIQDAKAKLNNTSWEIELKKQMLTAEGAKKAAPAAEKSNIAFRDNKVEISFLAKDGFTPTNYSVRLKGKDNEIVIWETMQTSVDKGVAFWRGEIENNVMRGVLSWQVKENNKQDYSFVSTSSSVAAAAPEVAAPAPAKTVTPVAAAPAQTSKKKGWWGK